MLDCPIHWNLKKKVYAKFHLQYFVILSKSDEFPGPIKGGIDMMHNE